MSTNNHHLTKERLRFGYGETSLGTVIVAVSSQGVAAILLGSDRRRLRGELAGAFAADAFANVELIEDEAGLIETIVKVVVFVDAPHLGLDLPLDPRGSELQL